ncbi:MAG: hypothetical protein GX643_06310 [Acidimicrobiales bacterium]|nr:hypothetical protein [Acidimicrobiales bacterium]
MRVPRDAVTLDDQRAALIADELVRLAEQQPGSGDVDPGRGGRRVRRLPVVVAAVVLVVGALVAVRQLTGSSSPTPMFTVTSQGGWHDFAPNLDVSTFDVEVAVEQLRDLGFTADRGTYLRWQDPSGSESIEAPSFGGIPMGGPTLHFFDGSQVKISIEAPFGSELPVGADGSTVDWTAAAAMLGMRDPSAPRAEPGFELRQDSPVTVYVLTAPSAVR